MPWECTAFKKQVNYLIHLSLQEILFYRYGDGYTILIRTSINSDSNNVINYIKERMPEASVKEEHNKLIHFRVPTNVPLHRMFSILETAREELTNIIEDYTVTQVTLDDVFVNFAKIQEENEISEQLNVTNKESWYKRSFFYKLFHKKRNNIVGKLVSKKTH
jgi:rubrerythrin